LRGFLPENAGAIVALPNRGAIDAAGNFARFIG
jgi:hypothetical protein